jgi:hypothetical protein
MMDRQTDGHLWIIIIDVIITIIIYFYVLLLTFQLDSELLSLHVNK